MKTNVCDVDLGDLQKIYDALGEASEFFRYRDRMNARVHLAKETRFSPLTSVVDMARERLETIIGCNLRRDVPRDD